MNVPEWFALGAGIALTLWWLRFCIRTAMWTWEEEGSNGVRKPNMAAGFFGGSVMFLTTPLWVPVYGFIKGFEKVDGRKILTERVFPEPK